MKKLILLVIFLFFMIVCSGCIKETNQYQISFEGKGGFGFDADDSTYCITELIHSKDELEQLSDKMDNGYFDEFSTNFNNEIALKVRSYDKNFFENNNLIICVIDASSSYDYFIDNLDLNENKLIINIKKSKKKGTFTDEAYSYLFIIEVNKNYTKDIEHLETKIK